MDKLEQCPLPPNANCEEVARLKKRIAELEMHVVRMTYYDNNATQSREFHIKFSDFLNPEEAMDIFIRNLKRIFDREDLTAAEAALKGGDG